jgi:DNA end-binding protein Ku
MKGAAAEEKEPAKAEGPRKPARAASKKSSTQGRSAAAAAKGREDDLESRSKQELYDMAQELDIDGRSKMTKKELIRAIQRSA